MEVLFNSANDVFDFGWDSTDTEQTLLVKWFSHVYTMMPYCGSSGKADFCGVSVDVICGTRVRGLGRKFVMRISDREKKLNYIHSTCYGYPSTYTYIITASSTEDAKYLRAIITLAI